MPVVFTWPIPIWDTVNLVQTMCDYPFLLPHELIEHIVRKGGLAQLLVAQEEFPELFRNLGAACRSHALPPGATIAVGIHGDGVPFTKKDSIEIISFNFLAMPTADRIPFTGISKKHLCHCGCKGKHTWHAILEVLKWSLLMCFVGRVSAYLPDGSAWQVARDGKGYAEDRRPNANVDPYVVTRLILETVCGAAKAPTASTKAPKKAVKKKAPAKKKVAVKKKKK